MVRGIDLYERLPSPSVQRLPNFSIAPGGPSFDRNQLEETNMICDFCNAPNPVWRFRARPFLIDYGPIAGESDADLAACNGCREMILADDRNGLVDRAMLMAPAIPDLPEADVRELRRWSQGLFFTHRVPCAPVPIA